MPQTDLGLWLLIGGVLELPVAVMAGIWIMGRVSRKSPPQSSQR